MKKIVFSVITFFYLVSVASAQTKGFAFGFKGGANLSKLSMGDFLTARLNANGTPTLDFNGQVIRDNLRESFDSYTGFAGGFWMRIGRRLYVQPEVMVSTKGGMFEVVKDGKPQVIQSKFTSFDVPLLVGMKASFLRFNMGPMVSFPVGNNQNLKDALSNYTTGSLNDALAKAVYGYQIGGGLDIAGVSVDVRYEGGLSDISALNLQSSAGSTQFSQRTKSWQVTLGFKVF
ncbi:MAG: porin family protein [Spirosomataceae bacterium]